jgi:fructose-1,6-bisphosphatase/inositol monophosphatase family enzyme
MAQITPSPNPSPQGGGGPIRGTGRAGVEVFVEPLRRLHDWIRGLVLSACEEQASAELSRVVHDGAGDVTYAIDRVSETALVDWFTREIASQEPIILIGEGLPEGRLTLPVGAKDANAKWRIIVDPIDGTRGLMYQKRPAWILTGVAPNHGEGTSVSDIELAMQTEIPVLKQHLSDQVWAVRGRGVQGVRFNRFTNESSPLSVRPSTATDLRHGFATVCRFFPGGRDVLAAIDDAICERMLSRGAGEVGVFEDQYACSGGQLFGLASGQDRFIADLRPLVQPLLVKRGIAAGHCCHPYDVCTKLIAEEAGVIVTDAQGQPLRSPLDTESNVSWVGYANRQLQSQIEPVLRELLREHQLISE